VKAGWLTKAPEMTTSNFILERIKTGSEVRAGEPSKKGSSESHYKVKVKLKM
jgi:hypothetical protein